MDDKKLSQRQIQHLYWRSGFGLPLNRLNLQKWNLKEELDYLFANRNSFEKVNAVSENNNEYLMPGKMRKLTSEERKEARKENRVREADVGLVFFYSMLEPKNALREKMSLFWLNHFACRFSVVTVCQSFLNTIRKNAIGSFKDLLAETIKHPGMLSYLNAKQNRKEKPNENMARELMELFTLGRGKYTETDVKEVARALTGWSFNKNLMFEFRNEFHDQGEKNIFEQTGNFNGDDVLEMILKKKECAYFITKKICREIIHENIEEEIVQNFALSFYTSGYDISKLLREIYNSNTFWEEKNIGTKIKSPFELIAGIAQITGLKFMTLAPFVGLQRMLGQELFRPPNVAGWTGGKSWIDNSTIISRTMLPHILFENYKAKIGGKKQYDNLVIDPSEISLEKKDKYAFDWSLLNKSFINFGEDLLAKKLLGYLIQSNNSFLDVSLINQSQNETNFIRSKVIQIMSLPEYQLC